MTFSIVARSQDATLYGIAIASSSPAVAARCAHVRAGVGAVATQSMTDPALGPQLLQQLERGSSARTALDATLAGTAFAPYRQLMVVGRSGKPAVHSGQHTLGVNACEVDEDAAAAGNLLANAGVPRAMLRAYARSSGHLGSRLLAALRAGLDQGGESGPIHSAGLLVVRDLSWPIVDLRVDWDDRDPLAALSRLWEIYSPQIEDYVARALNPGGAPVFGVPGEVR
jgi:uncharacterized Ntn-hydrolase superfamily protein